MPVLFNLLRCADKSLPARALDSAALALMFLSFSLSGSTMRTRIGIVRTGASAAGPPTAIVVLGWLGSALDEFRELDAYYARAWPGFDTCVTVGGNDCWSRRGEHAGAEGVFPASVHAVSELQASTHVVPLEYPCSTSRV